MVRKKSAENTNSKKVKYGADSISTSDIKNNTFLLAYGDDNALKVNSVYKCVRVLSESIGMLPIKLFKRSRNKVTVDYKHPLYKTLAIKPNDFQTSSEFWEYAVKCLCLDGNFYALKVVNPLGQVVELLPIDPKAVNIQRTDDYKLVYTVTTLNRKSFTVEAKEIFHVKLFTGSDCMKGISPISMARTLLDTDYATNEHARNLFSNGVVSNGVIELPDLLDEDSFNDFKNALTESYVGFHNSNKPLILEGGAKWNSISMSNADSQFLETRRFNREEIAGIFRVPPHLIGDLSHATFSNIEHQGLEFVQYSLMPYLVKIEQRILVDLISEDEKTDYYAKFNADALLRGDINSRMSSYQTAVNAGILSVNEAREKEDLSPIKGGDIYRVPLDHGYLDSNGNIINPNQERGENNEEPK